MVSSGGSLGSAVLELRTDNKPLEEGLRKGEGSASSFVGNASKAIGLLSVAVAGVGVAALGMGLNFNSELENTRAKLVAFTKDGKLADQMLAEIKVRASQTPFAFGEMAAATAALMPVAKASGVAVMELVKQAEILAASHPEQGLQGAAIALREATGGDFTSIVERFDLPRQRLKELAAQGVPALEAVSIAMQEMGYDADLVAGLAGTMTGRWSTFMDTVTDLAGTMSKPLFDLASKGLADLQVVLDANIGAMQGVASAIGGALVGAINIAVPIVMQIVDGFRLLWGIFADNLIPAFDRFREGNYEAAFDLLKTGVLSAYDAIMETLARLLSQLLELLPGLIDRLGQWGQALVAWVAPMVPPLLGALAEMVTTFWGWLLEQVPPLVDKLAAWAAAMVDWVAPFIPPLLVALGGFANTLFTWLVGQIPGIIDQLGLWATEFTAWIGPRIAPMLAELGALSSQLLDWLIATAPGIAQTFLSEWAPAAIAWVAEAAVNLLKELPGILLVVGSWAINEGVPKIKTLFFAMGEAIIHGILAGIQNLAGMLFDSLRDLASNALNAAKSALGIGSPSKEFAKVGTAMMQGAAMGIRAGSGLLTSAVDGAMNVALGHASGALSLTAAGLSSSPVSARSAGFGGGLNEDRLARKIAAALAGVSLRVGVDDIQSALVRQQRRNGTLGLI